MELPTPISCEELFKIAGHQKEELKKQISCDKSGITIKPNIHIPYEYFIPWYDIKNIKDIVQWTHHLGEKTWMQRKVLVAFLEMACDHIGHDIHGSQKE
jgi:hypothetical protein